MSVQELDRLVRKYYGYVADLEGSGVEVLDLLFVRDKIQDILEASTPDKQISGLLYERIYELDHMLWRERESFLMVVGEPELQHARKQERRPRSHWWWYLDELKVQPQTILEQRERLAQVFVPVSD